MGKVDFPVPSPIFWMKQKKRYHHNHGIYVLGAVTTESLAEDTEEEEPEEESGQKESRIFECFYHLYPSASDSGDWSHALVEGKKGLGRMCTVDNMITVSEVFY